MAGTKKGADASAKKSTKKTTKKTAPKKTPAENVAAVKTRRRVGDVSSLHEPIMNVLDHVGPKGSLPGQIAKAIGAGHPETTKALGELAEKGRALKPSKRGRAARWTAAPTTSAAA